MNSEKIGQFISELRKSHQMTQKELATKLNVSDKAVSKWERGLSCPDILLLSPLSELLGVTITELLNGETTGAETINVETLVTTALEYGKGVSKRKIQFTQNICASIFSILLLLGIAVVSIVDLAISGTFTWSLISICSSVFAWLIGFPAVRFGTKGIAGSLIALSIFIAPFLFVLDLSINRLLAYHAPVFSMGIPITLLSLVYIWIAFFVFKKLKTRKLLASAIVTLLASPLTFLINYIIAITLNQAWFDISAFLNIATPIIAAACLFFLDLLFKKRRTNTVY